MPRLRRTRAFDFPIHQEPIIATVYRYGALQLAGSYRVSVSMLEV